MKLAFFALWLSSIIFIHAQQNIYLRSAFCYWTLSKIFIYAQYFAIGRSAKSFCTLNILLLYGQHNLFARRIFCCCTVSIIFLHERENQQKKLVLRTQTAVRLLKKTSKTFRDFPHLKNRRYSFKI